MASLSRELIFLILQFLDEEKFNQTVHKLEQESGIFFNIKYFEDAVNNGEWDDVEKYLSGFTKIDDNRYSMKIFFEIRKQKYLEALDKHDRATAVEILVKELKVFAAFNDDLYKELAHLLTLDNFRENEQLSKYGDTKSARGIMLVELKKLIEANPLFHDKIHFPQLKSSRLRALINQSLNWQHQLCKNPKSNPEIKTLFTDHSCGPPNGARGPLMAMPKPSGGFPLLGSNGPFPPAPASLTTSVSGWMASPSSVTPAAASVGPMGLGAPSNAAMIKRPRTPNNPSLDYHSADSEHHMKRPRTLGISEETSNLPVNILPITFAGQSNIHYSSDELPKKVLMTLNQGSAVRSMDFHPGKLTLLLVGTNVGDVAVWELSSGERIAHRNFIVQDISSCSLQAALAKEPTISVNRVAWSPDGVLFGVAYSKHIVHLYSYHSGDDLRPPAEIDAHIGSVNDLAFAQPNKHLSLITCGDDKAIRVWDAASGSKLFTFEGHESPVFSVCPHYKESIQFIFSTATDGKIKAWLYDNMGSRVDYDAPGHCCTTLCYSADGTRLFSCGTTKEGDSHLVEWNESEGSVKRTYFGLRKRSVGVVQFDTTKNRFLAVGDEFVIKIWDMDNPNLMTTIETDGLPASPRFRFSRDGMLLAVSTNDNGIKILANTDGLRLLHPFEAARSASETIAKLTAISTLGTTGVNAGTSVGLADRGAPVASIIGMTGDNHSLADVKARSTDESMEKCKTWKLMEINEPSQCRSQRLPDNLLPSQVSRLIYTNMGNAILALASNAVHKLWKWAKTERNTNSKASSVVSPQLWQPTSGILMTNEICEANPEDAVPCFALSKNDSYVMSASGGKISLFNMMTFKTMTTFMAPPPAATFLAFHPQDNNVMAIGMDDSSIQIYNVRVNEVKSRLTGHQKRVTGLAFSNVLNVLVSSGADAQLCVWSTGAWEKQAGKFLQIPNGRVPSPLAEMCVQFHQDQIHFLAVHETQIAIYETSKLECLKQWVPPEPSVCITNATYSCDSQSIYASFDDGSVGVLSATLRLRCRIDPTAYIPPSMNSDNSRVYPLVIAAHPSEPNQFALGLSDGGVHVLEPLESEGRWGTMPPSENGAVPSSVPGQGSSDQVVR